MARWRLTAAHYLNVPGEEYEHIETDRDTGKRVRKLYPVPMFLDPKDPANHNYPGDIIVGQGETGFPRDLIFTGPPTPDMEPLDAEAEKITKEASKKWVNPMDALPGQGVDYSSQLLAVFERQLTEVINRLGGIPQAQTNPVGLPNMAVPEDAIARMQAQMNELMERNAELERRVAQMEHADDDTDLNAPPPAKTDQDRANEAARRV